MSEPFLEQLAQLCKDERVRAKWVLVPNRSLGWTLGERLLQAGCNWVNLRFTTPFQLALDSVAGSLLSRGINPSPETLGPSLIQYLLLQQTEPAYFRPLILQPGMAEALWSALMEFRMAGLATNDLKKLPAGDKRRELTRLFTAYEAHLAEHKLADRAAIFAEVRDVRAVQENDLVLAYPYTLWSPLELKFIKGLAGEHVSACATSETLPRRPGLTPRVAMSVSGPRPELFYAPRRVDELDEVLRQIRDQAIPLDEVEIAANPSDNPWLYDRLAAAGLPTTFEAGLPIETSPAHQAIAGLLNWVEHGYTAYHLRELLLAGSLRARPNSFTAANLLEAAQIGWGREPYHRQLEALRQYSLERASRDEVRAPRLLEQAEQITELANWLSELFRRFPAPDSAGTIDLARWLGGLQELLKELPGSDNDSRSPLLGALSELTILAKSRWPLAQALNFVRQRLKTLTWRSSRSKFGQLHIARPEHLGLSGRSFVFLIGMEEGRLIPAALEDCVFDDSDRARLHLGLRQSVDRPQEALFHLRERLATCQGRLTFSFASRDRAGDQEQWPSWLFFEAARLRYPGLASFDDLLERLGEPVRQKTAPPVSAAGLIELFPDLHRGALAALERASEAFTVYDGYVPSAAGAWDPRTCGMPISASRLSSLATCPFRIFLESGLHLARSPLSLPDPDVWLDAASRGTVLHEVYAAYYRFLRSRSWKPEAERDRAQLFQLLGVQLERVRALLPPPSLAVERAETAALKRDLEYFLALELENGDRTPVGLEVPFGMSDDAAEPMARLDPVVLDLGPDLQLPLRGRIDRIDRVPGGYSVVDYKTGRKLQVGRDGIYEKGRLLQHALYALAVEQLVDGPIVQSSYYFPTSAAVRPWIHFKSPEKSRLARVLTQVLEPLRSGAFVHSHKRENDCLYCDFRAACSSHRDDHAKAKLESDLLALRRDLLEEA